MAKPKPKAKPNLKELQARMAAKKANSAKIGLIDQDKPKPEPKAKDPKKKPNPVSRLKTKPKDQPPPKGNKKAAAGETLLSTISIPVNIHKDFRKAALVRDLTLTSVATSLIEDWVENPTSINEGSLYRKNANKIPLSIVYIPEDLHRRLRKETLIRDLTITSVITTQVEEWLKDNPPPKAPKS